MDKVRSTAWKTYVRVCFSSGLMVSLESICLLWKKNEWFLLLRVYAWCVIFSHIWQGSKTRTSYHKWSKVWKFWRPMLSIPINKRKQARSSQWSRTGPLFKLGSEGSENSLSAVICFAFVVPLLMLVLCKLNGMLAILVALLLTPGWSE